MGSKGNNTDVRSSPWKWVGLSWRSKLVGVPSGAMTEAFFMLTNKELRLALGRTGSGQWLPRGWAPNQPGRGRRGSCPGLPSPPPSPQGRKHGLQGGAGGPRFVRSPTGSTWPRGWSDERLLSLHLAHERSPVAWIHQLRTISNSRAALGPVHGQGDKRRRKLPAAGTKAPSHCWGCRGGSLGVLLSWSGERKRNIWGLGWRGQKRIFILRKELREPGSWQQKGIDRAHEFQKAKWSTCTVPALEGSKLPAPFFTIRPPRKFSEEGLFKGVFSSLFLFALFSPFLPFGSVSGRGEGRQCLVTKSSVKNGSENYSPALLGISNYIERCGLNPIITNIYFFNHLPRDRNHS